MTLDLLLISNSTSHGQGYLDHCEPNIRATLGDRKNVLFVPYARPSGITWDKYTTIARERFAKMGYSLTGIHEKYALSAIDNAESIFIGGGNTFMLLNDLYRFDLMQFLRDRIFEGIPYIGTSAGANVAGKTIKTTNDMPIVHTSSFDALGLVPFVINPHYLDPDPNSKHMGETRETRIKEYLAFNDDPVVALREGSMLRVTQHNLDYHISLSGAAARIFWKGSEPEEHHPGESLDFLLNPK